MTPLSIILIIALALALLVALAVLWRLRGELNAERATWRLQRAKFEARGLPSLFLSTADSLESGLLLLDRGQRIRYANHASNRILQATPSGVDGHSIISVLRDYQADSLIKAAIDSGERQSATLQPVLSSRILQITCAPLREPAEYSAIVLLRDVTQLAQLERARREMVANVSHELRTPLASIRLLVETLQSSPPAETSRRMLRHIDDELASMTHLVDELRELSQIESGRMAMTLRAADIGAIVERAAERVRPQAERRDLELHVELEPNLPPALIDDERIGQVLLNLLYNAVKFTPSGLITITARSVAEPVPDECPRLAHELAQTELDQAIVLAVADTGVGIPQSEVDRVFERFFKVDRARTRNSGGTGLGLAIAKHLVERHGGRIWVELTEGQGSTFSFLLPVA